MTIKETPEMMDETENKAAQKGWWFPLNSRKAHYFIGVAGISLCGKVMKLNRHDLEDYAHESEENCAKCKKLRAKLGA